jgi:hypothetical protein
MPVGVNSEEAVKVYLALGVMPFAPRYPKEAIASWSSS